MIRVVQQRDLFIMLMGVIRLVLQDMLLMLCGVQNADRLEDIYTESGVVMIKTIIFIILSLLLIVWILGMIWYRRPFKAMTWLYHDIFGWHKPNHQIWSNGFNNLSYCRFCDKYIMQDSHGNWFDPSDY